MDFDERCKQDEAILENLKEALRSPNFAILIQWRVKEGVKVARRVAEMPIRELIHFDKIVLETISAETDNLLGGFR